MFTNSKSKGKKPTPTSSTTGKRKAPKPISIKKELNTNGNTPMDLRPHKQAGGIPPPYTKNIRIQALKNQLHILTTQLTTQQNKRIQKHQKFINRINQLRDGIIQENKDKTIRIRDIGEIIKLTLPKKYNRNINCKRFFLNL